MAAQRGEEFSLAAALFGFPPADGYAEPTQHAPETWRTLFEEHADAGVRRGLVPTCKAGRDYHTPNQATYEGPEDRKWVSYIYDDSIGSLASIASRAKVVGERYRRVVELTLRRAPEADRVKLVPALVEAVVTCFPWLSTLTLDSPIGPLPDPSLLSNLQNLTLHNPAASTLASLADYTHVPSVRITGPVPQPLPQLFKPNAAPHTLSTFVSNADLDDSLLGLLLAHAPALGHLGVGRLALTADASQRRWGVGTLQMQAGHTEQWVDRLRASVGCVDGQQLARLPQPDTRVLYGRLSVQAPLLAVVLPEVTQAQGLIAPIVGLLPTWVLETRAVIARISPTLPYYSRVMASITVANQLAYLPHPKLSVWDLPRLPGRGPSRVRAQIIIEGLIQARYAALHIQPGIVQYGFALTDGLRADVLQCGTDIRSLTVDSLALQSDQHANTPWPWDTLTVKQPASAVQLVKLPSAAGRAGKPRVSVPAIQLAYRDMSKVSANRIAKWCSAVDYPHGPTFELLFEQTAPASSLYWLRSVTQACLFDADTASKASVVLSNAQLNHDVMGALTCVPQWGGVLEFRRCTFPLQPEAYTGLAAKVPSSYTSWRIEDHTYQGQKNGVSVLQCICKGVDAHRRARGLGPLCVELVADEAGCEQARSMRLVWEHVKVVVVEK